MAKSFSRDKAKYKPEPSVLIICEDKKSGKTYLEDAAIHFRANVHVELSHCGNTDPLGIVNAAIKRKHKYEHVFCAIDRDNHANFDLALELAKQNGIGVIASYPCFEFWLILHFAFSRKPYNRAGDNSAADLLIADLKKYPGMENYEKGANKNVFKELLEKLPQAKQFAEKVYDQAVESENLNPSTKIYKIIDFFETLGSPQKIT